MSWTRHDIYQARLDDSNVLVLNGIVKEACDSSGLERLDLTNPMKSDFDANGRWFNSEHDSHWNEYGHQFVARMLLERLGVIASEWDGFRIDADPEK